MPKAHSAGGLFWHKIRLNSDAPRHDRRMTYEYEHPFRCSRSHVIRLIGWIGVVVGRWNDERLPEYRAAALAAEAHPTEITDEVADRVRNYGWTIK
jgi:hypothetical protein